MRFLLPVALTGVAGCSFFGPDETHDTEYPAESATIARWTATDAGQLLGEGCLLDTLTPAVPIRFPARVGQRVRLATVFEHVKRQKQGDVMWTDEAACALHREDAPRPDFGVDSPACWGKGTEGSGNHCDASAFSASENLGFETIPANAPPLDACRFDGDGYVVTYRIETLGRSCYAGAGFTNLIAFETFAPDSQ